MTTTLDGRTVPYIVRWERGTINRFIYSVAMLAPTTETDPDAARRLALERAPGLQLRGRRRDRAHTRARPAPGAMLLHDVLQLGYAVVDLDRACAPTPTTTCSWAARPR